MKNNKLQWLNIAPLQPEHKAENNKDLLEMYAAGIITETAFMMTLVPENDPPVDKAAILAEQFEECREGLKGSRMPVGILIQATIGHGWAPNARAKFQGIINKNGGEPYQFCPLGEDFREYIAKSVKTLAALKPDFFMVDDDFRLLTGRDGCYCPLHIAEFNRRTGKNYTRATLVEAVYSEPKVAREYDELLKDSLVGLAKVIRRAMNSVDPELPCSFCMCSLDTRHAPAIARVLAGKHDMVIRLNNGRYLNDSLRSLPAWLNRTACQVADLPGINLLAEPDTCPQNRYSTSAAMLNAHIILSLLEGCKGGKLWLTRIGMFEPASGVAYRRKLAENAGFYRAVAGLEVEWQGAASPFPAKPFFNFPSDVLAPYPTGNWMTNAFGWMGIPFYFAKKPSGLTALSGDDCATLSDDDLRGILKNDVLVDGSAAIALTQRGFSAGTGVAAKPWSLKPATLERTAGGRMIAVGAAIHTAELHPLSDETKVISTLYHRPSGISPEEVALTPGCTVFTKKNGRKTVVLAIPQEHYGFNSFSMLNETRKAMILDLLKLLGGVPVWYVGDEEVLLKTGVCPGGKRIIVLVDDSLDDIEGIRLGMSGKIPGNVEKLMPDGSWQAVKSRAEAGMLVVEETLRTLRPMILRMF